MAEPPAAPFRVGTVVGACATCGSPSRLRKRYRLDPTKWLAWCDNATCGHADLIDDLGVGDA